jgi:hypothetical protein
MSTLTRRKSVSVEKGEEGCFKVSKGELEVRKDEAKIGKG